MATGTKYTVAGELVEAVKSEGNGFYEVTVVKTGEKLRCLAQAFEAVAKEHHESQEHNGPSKT